MENLKSVIPDVIKRKIAENNTRLEALPSICSSLHDYFIQSSVFHQMIDELTNPEIALCSKNKEEAIELKKKGNECFSATDYSSALNFYSKVPLLLISIYRTARLFFNELCFLIYHSAAFMFSAEFNFFNSSVGTSDLQALRLAPMDATDKMNSLVAALYVNRASTLHRMGLVQECLRDCSRAISINPSYVKAWYRRGRANVSLQNYKGAVCDFKLAVHMEQSPNAKSHIENVLRLIDGREWSDCMSAKCGLEKPFVLDEEPQMNLHCVSTPAKGRGMAFLHDIEQASLIHREEPYAAVLLKSCRETHCHFCFNKLPADVLFCESCSIPLYCSDSCQQEAGGLGFSEAPSYVEHIKNLPDDLQMYLLEVVSQNNGETKFGCFAEHGHECHGVYWPAVLPSDVVLAGRVLVKSIKQKELLGHGLCAAKNLELCHNYMQFSVDIRLEMHVYAVVLLYCLKHSYDASLQLDGAIVSEIVIIMSQIKVNSMAVIRFKFSDTCETSNQPHGPSFTAFGSTSNIEQVAVGQALYLGGSFFNHSCNPNIHAYFLSRTLLIRSTQFVEKGCPLELSYGPQVGQLDCGHRQQFLREKYYFGCQCSSCTELNLSDLVLDAFQCVKPNCFGVVLNCFTVGYERHKTNGTQGPQNLCNFSGIIRDLNRVASLVCQQTNFPLRIEPGSCLSCGSMCDLETLHATADEAQTYIKSLKQQTLVPKEVRPQMISKALKCLEDLKSTLHPYNKKVAEAEDTIAEAYCLVGKFGPAITHCTASVEILKRLYNPFHVVIGNELVKLSSIRLTVGDHTVVDNINRLLEIFAMYYGSHANVLFPYLKCLKHEGWKLANERPT